ncbi:hypothetical protein COY88_00295 [Candidatus Roizmanbacteria bacterium CG_4_10_14_0_8_um_filter_35_28]|uniref:ComEC/Rec2-related protein domain-containing protein n=1 Tax=Candidatus Roizmanbacteria bacterium CG_4_10_14_0_8_um_filter_35_28 TaxID=1974827 RepID=A0A2M7QGH8_9BACT|nr:MAG: hypothetical protein COY88_00295 [Candidatus Roizmanbacteria bacterium CG_4_10_14_0_8_um_filter_35_28]
MLVAILFLLLILMIFLFFIPPTNLITILSFDFFLSLLISLVTKLFLPKKYPFFIFISCFIFFSLLTLKLFEPVNLLLAISFIIGLIILLK